MLLVPYAVERPPRRLPFVTYSLLGLNVLTFLLSVWFANHQLPHDKRLVAQDWQRLEFGMRQEAQGNPGMFQSAEAAQAAFENYLARHFDYAMLWRLQNARSDYVIEPHYTTVLTYGLIPQRPTWWALIFSHLFLHSDLFHLLGNMLFLWLLGRALEDALGWWLFGLSYLVGGLAAAILQIVMTQAFSPASPALPMVGASGAISSVMGMFALRFYRTKIHVFYLWIFYFLRWGTFAIASAWGIGLWVLQDVVGGILDLTQPERHGGVAHWAHLGGFGLGLIYALLIKFQAEGKAEYALEDAEEAFAQRRFPRAAALAAQFLTKHPNDGDAHLLRARSLTACGDFADAMPHFAKAIAAALSGGRVHESADVYAQAEQIGQLSLDPSLHFTLANRLAGAGEFEAAAQAFRSFALAYPEQAQAAWALVKAAQIFKERLHRAGEAQKLFALARERYPNNRWTQEMP